MVDKRKPPKLFDVMPARELSGALRANLPEDAAFTWRHVGSLKVGGAKLTAMDPSLYRPGRPLDEGWLLDWPHEQADIWLQVLATGPGVVLRVATVMVATPLCRAADVKKTEIGSSAVDSAKMMIADTLRLGSAWHVGGPRNQSDLGKAESQAKIRKKKLAAIELLTASGFKLRRDERATSVSFIFDGPLTDEDIARASKLLKDAGSDEQVNVVQPHSLALVEDGMKGSFVVDLKDERGSPFLYAFESGFGDGIYWWDALKCGEEVVGYTCNFLEDDSGDG